MTMSNEMPFDDAMDSLCQIMLNEWSKEEIIEYIRSRDGYTKNDMTAIIPTVTVTDAPMVEYAPVIRCKDCKWWDEVDNIDGVNYGTCERKCTAIRQDVFPNENWFCADGVRKE